MSIDIRLTFDESTGTLNVYRAGHPIPLLAIDNATSVGWGLGEEYNVVTLPSKKNV